MADKLKENEGIVSPDSLQDPFETANKSNQIKPLDTNLQFHELNFFAIPTQSNIYGLTGLASDSCSRLLVATLGGTIYSLTFNQQSMQSSLKPVGFSYIPALAEIISIDMFVTENHGPIVGVTLIIKKDPNSPKEIFFNIYGLHTKPTRVPDWERIAEDWQTQNLSYTPFLLTHTQVPCTNGSGPETVFLVSGDDCKVHVYRHISEEIGFHEELLAETFFPEFEELNSSITCVDFFINNSSSTRLTALGCQNGYIRCSKVDLTTNRVSWYCDSSLLDGPITSVRLFNDHTHNTVKGDFEAVHLLVTSAIEIGCVFTDILQSDLKCSPLLLQNSDLHDSVLCSEVADTNWNGRNEIILGTYGKKLLVYSLFQKVSGEYDTTQVYEREFAHPIHRIMYCDITRDGLCEIIVLSSAGLHVLQHDLCAVRDESNIRLKRRKN